MKRLFEIWYMAGIFVFLVPAIFLILWAVCPESSFWDIVKQLGKVWKIGVLGHELKA